MQRNVRFPQINLGHFVLKFFISPKYSGPQIIADIPTQIDWHLKIQNTLFLWIKFLPPIFSPLHSTRGKTPKIVSKTPSHNKTAADNKTSLIRQDSQGVTRLLGSLVVWDLDSQQDTSHKTRLLKSHNKTPKESQDSSGVLGVTTWQVSSDKSSEESQQDTTPQIMSKTPAHNK